MADAGAWAEPEKKRAAVKSSGGHLPDGISHRRHYAALPCKKLTPLRFVIVAWRGLIWTERSYLSV